MKKPDCGVIILGGRIRKHGMVPLYQMGERGTFVKY
jgi:hypothetical protein